MQTVPNVFDQRIIYLQKYSQLKSHRTYFGDYHVPCYHTEEKNKYPSTWSPLFSVDRSGRVLSLAPLQSTSLHGGSNHLLSASAASPALGNDSTCFSTVPGTQQPV